MSAETISPIGSMPGADIAVAAHRRHRPPNHDNSSIPFRAADRQRCVVFSQVQRRHEHFAWSEAITHLVPFAPIGRVTNTGLQLNRERVINVRLLMISARLHPPSQ
jgi:hypothetical protein